MDGSDTSTQITKVESKEIEGSTSIDPSVSFKIPSTTSLLDKADAVAKRIEDANRKAEELVQRHEAVAARMLLSGKAEAGQAQKTKEEIDKANMDDEVAKTLKMFRSR